MGYRLEIAGMKAIMLKRIIYWQIAIATFSSRVTYGSKKNGVRIVFEHVAGQSGHFIDGSRS